ncbi:MAG: 4-vinyl reductase [Chloroflexota bacterium]
MPTYFYPPKMGRIILHGMEEVMGRNGMDTVLHFASLDTLKNDPKGRTESSPFSFEVVSLLQKTLEQIYGPRGGRGLALRIGRACFKYGLREYGSILGLTEMAFRLLPLSTKIHMGAQSFAELFNRDTDQRVRIDENDQQVIWHIEHCPLCWERKTDEPVCHMAVGLLQESLYWLSGGKIFNVEETACIGRGDAACTIVIDKVPLS